MLTFLLSHRTIIVAAVLSATMIVYGQSPSQAEADSIVKYQLASGGWAKNMKWDELTSEQRQYMNVLLANPKGIGATIDNGATTREMAVLAAAYQQTGNKRYRQAFLCGLNYLFAAQYANGGWPQFYPSKGGEEDDTPPYSDHITFNDNAMRNVLLLLDDVAKERGNYKALRLSSKERQQARKAFDRGIECILNCQIRKDGQLTVWCQQHDEYTLAPAPARRYELASLTGCGETVGLIQLLLSLPNPSNRVKEAVKGAVEWLKSHAIKDMTLDHFTNNDGKPDCRLIHRFGATIWARYYDLETEEPFVCDRDGIPQPSLEYIGYERRNGYRWYGTDPEKVINTLPSDY